MKTKPQNLFRFIAPALLALSILNADRSTAFAQGAAFTYQGRLDSSGAPANGAYDLRFAIYDANANGNPIGSPLTNAATAVSNGLFTVTLDFGADVFNGSDRWIELGVRTNGSAVAFVALSPRQPITSAPYAIRSANAATANVAASANSVAAANVTGALALGQLPAAVVTNNATGVTIGGTFTGNGGGLTNLNAAQLSGTVPLAQLPGAVLTNNESGDVTFNGTLTLPDPATIYSGGSSLLHSDTAFHNFFAGVNAGNLTMSGSYNTANGEGALLSNTSGDDNTANGSFALRNNTSGSFNTANGVQALYDNTTGSNNTANGIGALFSNTSGSLNTANGADALAYNSTGNNNTANGSGALLYAWSGTNNIGLGYFAGANLIWGSSNIYIGSIGGSETENNTIRIGSSQTQTFIAGVINSSGISVGGGGTTFSRVEAGQAAMSSGSATVLTNFTIAFPQAFNATPKVTATVSADPGYPNVNDTFVLSIRNISATSFTVNIVRVDSAVGWSQHVRVNWQAWE